MIVIRSGSNAPGLRATCRNHDASGSSSLMKTDAVICIVLTSTRPSWTPLARTAASTSGVMFRNAIFDGMFRVRYFVCAFMPRKIPHSMPSDPFELVRKWFDAFNAGDLGGSRRSITRTPRTIPEPTSREGVTR